MDIYVYLYLLVPGPSLNYEVKEGEGTAENPRGGRGLATVSINTVGIQVK